MLSRNVEEAVGAARADADFVFSVAVLRMRIAALCDAVPVPGLRAELAGAGVGAGASG